MGVWAEEGLYFPTDPDSVKGVNLTANPAATTHVEAGPDVLIVEGTVGRVSDDDTVRHVDEALAAKYMTPQGRAYSLAMDPANRVWLFRPSRAIAWSEAVQEHTFARWVWNGPVS